MAYDLKYCKKEFVAKGNQMLKNNLEVDKIIFITYTNIGGVETIAIGDKKENGFLLYIPELLGIIDAGRQAMEYERTK